MKKENVITISEFLQRQDYLERLERKLKAFAVLRKRAIKNCPIGKKPKAHPIDEMIAQGQWNAEYVSKEFQNIINKESRLSAYKRDFIENIAFPVARELAEEIKKNEAEGNTDSRNNQ